jgi:transcriptional regulator with XRE-family HTH domain
MHKLEQIRKKLGISKTEMARKLDISKSNYSMIIHGQHGVSKRVAIKAYEEFGIPIEELLCPEVQGNATRVVNE